MGNYDSGNNGCGCIVMIMPLLIVFGINKCMEYTDNHSNIHETTYQSNSDYNNVFDDYDSPNGENMDDNLMSEEDRQYLGNSLKTGATPYKDFYGKNYRCPYAQCSGIEVTAPKESDIVVIIKKNNSQGKVIAHGYIKAGNTNLFNIPDGIYQTFFYYGTGWNPNKEMENGVTGGFVSNELFSKDNPQEIYSGVLTYVLQLQTNGNFQTKGSNPAEVF